MLYKYDVLMTSALLFTTDFFCKIRNKDVKVGPCLRSKLQLLKLSFGVNIIALYYRIC